MANPKNKKNSSAPERTRSIPVKQREEPHYTLHIMPAQEPRDIHREPVGAGETADQQSKLPGKPVAQGKNGDTRASGVHSVGSGVPRGSGVSGNSRKKSLNTRIWRTLEWLATSALIFMILFFAMNFSSYFELFKMKLDKLRGTYTLSPYIEQMIQPTEQNPSQELLPVTKTVEESRQQVPELVLPIAPPDDRIIIPRINKNIPIVSVKTENLLKRDWNALEKDIQNALKDGVVHYPGTAEPGQHGNVVITGHSSYFAWDPGRFKDVFALLHEVAVGDTVFVYHEQEKYTYVVYETKVVKPDQVDVLTQQGGDRLTLITCTPVGTNLKRLIVLAKPV
jgi:LPXTG-site transpeptidase (sortase) family protein